MHTAKLSLVVLVFLFFAPHHFVVMAETDQHTASSALNRAEKASASAFQAVVKAEIIGGNVSDLLTQMNDAGMYMTKAQVAFGFNNYDETISHANQCYGISSNVESQANKLRIEADIRHDIDTVIKVVVSAVSSLIICVGSFFAWRAFKRRYQTRSLKMKPEVNSDES
jgi:hypothetical protein